MASLWQQIINLFKAAENSSPSRPVIKKAIERTAAQQSDYDNWNKSLSKRRLLDWLHAEYVNYLVNPEHVDEAIDFIQVRATMGFAIHFHQTNYPLRDINHLFDYLKQQIQTTGYRPYSSDSRTYNRQNWVEQVDRHYLKPPINLREPGEKIDQKFGNITIELLFRNDKAYQLKFSATSYNDRNYKEAEDFNTLMNVVKG